MVEVVPVLVAAGCWLLALSRGRWVLRWVVGGGWWVVVVVGGGGGGWWCWWMLLVGVRGGGW